MAMKLQIWSMDLIFAIVIFTFTMTVLGVTWLHISNGLSTSLGNSQGIIYLQTTSMTDVLLSAGSPQNWQSIVNPTSAVGWQGGNYIYEGIVPGILATPGQPQISSAKLYALMSMASSNYTATLPLFGVGSNYYIVIGSPGQGVANITIGKSPFIYNASTIFVNKRSAQLNGQPVTVTVMVWSNSTASAS